MLPKVLLDEMEEESFRTNMTLVGNKHIPINMVYVMFLFKDNHLLSWLAKVFLSLTLGGAEGCLRNIFLKVVLQHLKAPLWKFRSKYKENSAMGHDKIYYSSRLHI